VCGDEVCMGGRMEGKGERRKGVEGDSGRDVR
jgi:hypothetical protein